MAESETEMDSGTGREDTFDSDIEEDEEATQLEEDKIESEDETKMVEEDVKLEANIDSKKTVIEKETDLENQFIELQNEIISLETIPKRRRTQEQRDELKVLKKKYHRKRPKYPHLLLILRDQKKANQSLIKSKIIPKPENKKPPCFGLGTKSSPLVNFYFTSPCPQLGRLYSHNYFIHLDLLIIY